MSKITDAMVAGLIFLGLAKPNVGGMFVGAKTSNEPPPPGIVAGVPVTVTNVQPAEGGTGVYQGSSDYQTPGAILQVGSVTVKTSTGESTVYYAPSVRTPTGVPNVNVQISGIATPVSSTFGGALSQALAEAGATAFPSQGTRFLRPGLLQE